jgi:cobalt-zinc-cadmium efflux system membrane fusion protein
VIAVKVETMGVVVQRLMRILVVLIVVVGLPVLGFVGMPRLKEWWDRQHPRVDSPSILAEKMKPRGTLVGANTMTLRLPQEVVETLQVQTAEVQPARTSDTLRLDGSLFLDANRLVHVSPRFSGDVIELGQIEVVENDPIGTSEKRTTSRSISFGDNVQKGQLLAVIWSKELGEKKSELVEALTALRFDQEKLQRMEESFAKGVVPERTVLDVKHEVESDTIAIARVERTLRSWRLSTEQIQAIRSEAERVRARKGDWHEELDESWARVEIRSPMDGTLVEKNVAVGDFVGTDLDLFKIADLRRLDVLAHIYEEDIPLLEALLPGRGCPCRS